jgi:hypothetical protein
MSIRLENDRIRLVSHPLSERKSLVPLVVTLAFSWLFLAIWLGIACFVLFKVAIWGVALVCSALLFAIYLGLFTQGLIRDAFREYVFELTDMDAVLTVEDKLKQNRSVQMVLLNDIKYAEYYPYTDSACIIFHAPYTQMEVPLWPMGAQGQDVVDFLSGRGVKVINVQTDDKIPD